MKYTVQLTYEIDADDYLSAIRKLARFHADTAYNQVQTWARERNSAEVIRKSVSMQDDKGMDIKV